MHYAFCFSLQVSSASVLPGQAPALGAGRANPENAGREGAALAEQAASRGFLVPF